MAEKLQRAVPYGGCFGVAFREPADAVEDRPRRGLKRLRHLGRALQRGANCLSARLKRRVCEPCDDLIIWRGLDRGKKFGTTVGGVPAIALVRGEADPIEARLELRDELLRRLAKLRLLFAQILGQPRDSLAVLVGSAQGRTRMQHGPTLLATSSRQGASAREARLVEDVSDLGLGEWCVAEPEQRFDWAAYTRIRRSCCDRAPSAWAGRCNRATPTVSALPSAACC